MEFKTSILDAISRMASLRHLYILLHSAFTPGERALLSGLSSSLTSLGLSFINHCDPLPFLSENLLATLETLHLHRSVIAPAQVPLQQLKSLTIEEAYTPTITLVSVFPSLQRIRLLDKKLGTQQLIHQNEYTEMDVIRATDRLAQVRAHSWSSLDVLAGNLILLYKHAIYSHVRTLHVEKNVWVGSHDSLLHAILQDARPTRLELTLCHFDDESSESPKLLDAVRTFIPVEYRLKHLSLRVL